MLLYDAIVENTTERRQFELTSLIQLREAVKNNTDQVLRDTFKDSIFVGCVSEKHCLIQHGTRLYIFCLERVAEEFFYQKFLDEFGNCGVICLSVIIITYGQIFSLIDRDFLVGPSTAVQSCYYSNGSGRKPMATRRRPERLSRQATERTFGM